MVRFKKTNRKAISPIIATVLIIAVTLIAAVAIGGFVFGLFGSSTNTAQVAAVSAAIPANVAAQTAGATCATAAGAATIGNLQFSNTGSANTNVVSLTITYGGKTYQLAVTGAGTTTCNIPAGGSLFIQVTGIGGAAATSGSQFSGYIVTNNGAQVVFAGAFS